MPQYRTGDGNVVDGKDVNFFDSETKQAPSLKRDWAIDGVLILALIAGFALPLGEPALYAGALATVASVLQLFWLGMYLYRSLRPKVEASGPRTTQSIARSFPSFLVMGAALIPLSHGTHLFGALLAWGVLQTLITTVAVEALLAHLHRPYDSIENRAERDAAALCFLGLWPVAYALTVAGTANEAIPNLVEMYGCIAMTVGFLTLRNALIQHRS